jgi:hypothetical protein
MALKKPYYDKKLAFFKTVNQKQKIMKNFRNYLKTSIAIIVCFTLANDVFAQQTGNPLMGLSTTPITYVDFNAQPSPALQTLPSYPYDSFDPDDVSTWHYDLLSEKYRGQPARFAFQVINDKYGNPLLFIVDDFIYDANGLGIIDPENMSASGYFNLHGNTSYFDPCDVDCEVSPRC